MTLPNLWSAFSPSQRCNIFFYVCGIMCYKFGLEYFNGAFLSLANERFDESRYEKIGILTGLHYAAQGLGSIAISPMIKKMPMRMILGGSVMIFAIVSAMLLIADATTGGRIKTQTEKHSIVYGVWNPNLMFPIFTLSGVSYGMIELIRRVVPRDIVEGDPARLRKMDSLVHVLYETAGTFGALTSSMLIGKLGANYSALLSPILFSLAALFWWGMDIYRPISDKLMSAKVEYEGKRASPTASLETFCSKGDARRSLIHEWGRVLKLFARAFYYGAWMCFTHRRFAWLIPSYTFALHGHRYLEYGIVQIFAKGILGNSGLAQVIVGGSNLGEMLGALNVMLFTQAIPTPIPWLRLDALLLNLVWIIPLFPISSNSATITAWKIGACIVPISYGWAGGDCSLSAYIQATVGTLEDDDDDISALGAVMAFLYVSYIVMYAIISTLLGRWVDTQLFGLDGQTLQNRARYALKLVGGVHFSILGLVTFAATFVPKGSLSWNPVSLIEE